MRVVILEKGLIIFMEIKKDCWIFQFINTELKQNLHFELGLMKNYIQFRKMCSQVLFLVYKLLG